MDYVPLRVHSRYSPFLSIVDPAGIGVALENHHYSGAILIDRGVLFGVVEAERSCADRGIALGTGAEVVVRFPRPGGGLPPPAYTLTLIPESDEGRRNLGALLELIARSDRPSRLQGVAEWIELAEYSAGLIAMSGGLTGPISGAFLRGRVGDARRVAAGLTDLFGTSRIFLETTRCGSAGEEIVEPFLREMGERYGLRRVAADPVRYLHRIDKIHYDQVRFIAPDGTVEDPPDPEKVEGDVFLAGPGEMKERYRDEPGLLLLTHEIAERSFRVREGENGRPSSRKEMDELIRFCVGPMGEKEDDTSHWRRKEKEKRFWEEFWYLDEEGLLPAVARLSKTLRAIRRGSRVRRITTSFLSGSLIGKLSGLQEGEEETTGSFPAPTMGGGACPIRVDADRESACQFRRLFTERFGSGLFSPFLPRRLNKIEIDEAMQRLSPPSGEGSGSEPHPPTTSLSGDKIRGDRGPDPLLTAETRRIVEESVVRYDRNDEEFLWTEDVSSIWGRREEAERTGAAPLLHITLNDSPLLNTLRVTRSIPEKGDPYGPIRRGEWTGIVEGGHLISRELVQLLAPRSVGDLALLLAVGNRRGPRRDLLERIAGIRAGERPPPFQLPRMAALLKETDGVPFYREQLIDLIREMTGCSASEAGTLVERTESKEGVPVSGERALFLRRSADRGLPAAVAIRFFSFLLSYAPRSARRADLVPVARRMITAAARKNHDPVRFCTEVLNDRMGERKRMTGMITAFRAEGMRFLPLDRNRSVFRFRVETEGIRTGLAIIPGMTGSLASVLVDERKEGGPFGRGADLLERLAARPFPRRLLLEIARLARGGESRRTVPGPGRVAEDLASAPAGEGRRKRIGKGLPGEGRGWRGGTQTGFSFLESTGKGKTGKRRGMRSSVKREKK